MLLVAVGAIGAAVAALADPIGIGVEDVFGWLQITGVVLGAVVALAGLVVAAEWVPVPGRAREVEAGTGTQNTTIVEDSAPRTAGQNTTIVEDSEPRQERPAG